MTVLQSLPFFKSELLIVGGFFAALTLDFFTQNKKWVALVCLGVLVGASLLEPNVNETRGLFFGFFLSDPLTHFFKLAVYVVTGLVLLASLSYDQIPKKQTGEFYAMMLVLTLLLTLMSAATNLLMIFLAIESVSITSYLLTGFQKFDKRSSEAAVKYVLFGAVSTALMLFGISLLFGLTGKLDLSEIASKLALHESGMDGAALMGMLFLLAGVGFKISMAPFHMWAPDVYQGAPTPVASFLTVAPKAMGFAVLTRILFYAFPAFHTNWSALLIGLSIFTMTFGNVLAVSQSNMKRLLAYSSVAQAGYILAALALGSLTGVKAVLIYVAAYLFTNLGAFFSVLAIERGLETNDIGAYSGLSKKSPFLALCLTLFLLSLAGIPPFAGFIGKVFIFTAVVEAKKTLLAIFIALNSAVAAYYYLKAVKSMYFSNAISNVSFKYSPPVMAAIVICVLGIFLIGFHPSPLLQLVEHSVAALPVS